MRAGRGWSPGRVSVAALVVYLLSRCVSTGYLLIARGQQEPYPRWTGEDGEVGLLDMSVLWDGSWYRAIAEDGYPSELPLHEDGTVRQNQWAFYPLFPVLSRILMIIPGVDFRLAGTVVALVAGAGAAVLMARLFARYTPAPLAVAAVGVWAVQPAAPTMQVAYTESLATLVLVAALTALVDRRWYAVAGLAFVLGLTRPITLPFALVVGLVFLWEARRWWQGRERDPRDLIPPLLATVIAGASGLMWATIVGIGTGVPDGYPQTMAAWRASGEIVPFRPWIDNTAILLFRDAESPRVLAALAVGALAVFLVAAAAGPWAARLPPELRLWMVAYPAYLAAVLDVGTSLIRYAVPLFPLALVLIGGGLRRPPRWWPLLAGVVVLALVWLQYRWTLGLFVFVPPSDYPP